MKVTSICGICCTEFEHLQSKARKYCSQACYYKAKQKPIIVKVCGACKREYQPSKKHAAESKYCSKQCAADAKRKPRVVRICGICKVEFLVRVADKVQYCGRACANEALKKERAKKVCVICGKEFSYGYRKNRPRKYCSYTCAGKARTNQRCIFVTCENCGTVFSRAQSIANHKMYFCDKVCYNEYHTTFNICLQCGNSYRTQKGLVEKGITKFCSKDCHSVWMAENCTGENAPAWKKKTKAICLFCKTSFYASVWNVEHGFAIYCSRICKDTHHRGENCHFWQGGISDIVYPREFNKAYRKYIRERDDYVCVLCGKYGASVHHINYDKKDSGESNLITLCKSCHGKTNSNRLFYVAQLSLMSFERNLNAE